MNKYNLIDILSKEIEIDELNESKIYKFDGIQIPMIQRDYAQGREDESELRNRFLNSIFYALEKAENLELDFVYGSIRQIDKKNLFIPLDGQQRLTTLFLLYWYIGNRELDEQKLSVLRDTLKRFSYATRITARTFCEKLSEIKISYNIKPSEEINNAAWFFASLKKDPTVKAMLVMLDSIHAKYGSENKNLIENLSALQFYILPLNGFELSDELYIKMNARGKQLTDFENFKADLINWLKDEKNTFKDNFHQEIEFNGRTMPYFLKFASKLDNNWTNLFWEYSKVNIKTEDKIVDPYFVRFWNRYLLCVFVVDSNISLEAIEKDNLFQKFYGKEGNESFYKYENFDLYKSKFENEGTIERIEKILDSLSTHYSEIKQILKPSWDLEDKWSLFESKINQRQRIIFLAVLLYLEKNEFDSVKLKNWLRVVWNISIDPDFRSIPIMITVMQLVKKLSAGCADIYKFLAEEDFKIIDEKSFLNGIMQEEKLKAKLIIDDVNWENVIIKAESHPLFLGSIGFLLLNNPTILTFTHRLEKANLLFKKGTTKEYKNDHRLMRALISRIDNWNTLFNMNLADSFDNWQLLLRRNSTVKKNIGDFCDLENEQKLNERIDELIIQDSQINAWNDSINSIERAQLVHKQLYSERKFHNWMQQNGAVNLRWWENHIYVYRFRSWYDWVMLDTHRNKLLTELEIKFNLSFSVRCDKSHFYKGNKILVDKQFNNGILSIELDNLRNIIIGLRKDKNNIDNISFEESEIDNNWIFKKQYNYPDFISNEDSRNLVNQIDKDIFDKNISDSLISKLEKHPIKL